MLHVLLRRCRRETQALEQAHRTKIFAFEHGGEAAYPVVPDKLGDHRLNGLAREAATPVSAGQLVGDCRARIGMHRCLNVTDELESRDTAYPVEPIVLPLPPHPPTHPLPS